MRTNKNFGDSVESSFRDPAGFLFYDKAGNLLRQINEAGATDYDLFMASGFYKFLTQKDWLIKHEEVKSTEKALGYKLIKPVKVPFITYPFEWSFNQLKDAALLTLKIQKQALKHGMSLKDATAYNIQFFNGKAIFIDTLSFEKYRINEPWQAYRQFCQHFLAPLVLMSYFDLRLSQLSRIYIDGVPLDLAKKLLPLKARLKPSVAMHLVWHSKAQQAKAGEHKKMSGKLSLNSQLAILDNLKRTITGLKAFESSTEWGEYYDFTNYSSEAADEKARLISKMVEKLPVKTALDIGGNNGRYSRVLNKTGIFTVCADIDPIAVDSNYSYAKENNEVLMLPLLVDLTNPGGYLGWQNEERTGIDKRLKADLVMALALIHHLAISNNLPLVSIAGYFSRFSPYLLIEFVPKADSQVQKLLSTRRDIFDNYDEKNFEKEFAKIYRLVDKKPISGTKRTLYLFKTR